MADRITIRELVTLLGFDVDEKKLKNWNDGIEVAKRGALALQLAWDAAVGAAALLVHQAIETGNQVLTQSQLLGLSAEQYQRYAYAAKQANVSNEEFTLGTKTLIRTIGDAIALQPTATAAFRRIQISPDQLKGQTTDQVLQLVMSRLQGVTDAATRASIAQDLFGRSGANLAKFFGGGLQQVKDASRVVQAFGFFSDATAAESNVVEDALNDVFTLLKGIKTEVGIGLFPAVKKLAEGFREWVLANRELIKTRIQDFVVGLTNFIERGYKALAVFVGWVVKAVDVLGGLSNAIALVTAATSAWLGAKLVLGIREAVVAFQALTVAELEALAVPIAIAAAIFALILALQDLYVWVKGGKSVLGDMFGSFADLKKTLSEPFSGAGKLFEDLRKLITLNPLDHLGQWKTFFAELGKLFTLPGTEKLERILASLAALATQGPAGLLANFLGSEAVSALGGLVGPRSTAQNSGFDPLTPKYYAAGGSSAAVQVHVNLGDLQAQGTPWFSEERLRGVVADFFQTEADHALDQSAGH